MKPTENVVQGVPVTGQQQQPQPYALPEVHGTPLYKDCPPGARDEIQKFVVSGYKDVWAAVLFWGVFLMTLIWGCINYASNLEYVRSQATEAPGETIEPPKEIDSSQLAFYFFVLVAAGCLAAAITLTVLSKFPRQSIVAANVACGVIYIILSLASFAQGAVFSGLLFLFIGAIQLLWLYLVRHRIPFAALLMHLSTRLVQRYKAMVYVSLAAVLAFCVFSVFFFSMVFPTLRRISEGQQQSSEGTEGPKEHSQGKDLALLFFFLIIGFWVPQVAWNVSHVTASGVIATWYFVGDRGMPPNPTAASFKRATTTSFGSICFGSLLVAIIQTLRTIAESQRNHRNGLVACCMVCLLSILQRILEYFNRYAFVHVAIYGCGYVEAAKRTWALAKQCFWAALFNDCLVGPTIQLTALCVSFLISTVVWAFVGLAVAFLCFFVTLAIQLIVLRPLDSAIVTIFVCYAELPHALQTSSPELYNAILSADVGRDQV